MKRIIANGKSSVENLLRIINFDTNLCAMILFGLIIMTYPIEQPNSVTYKKVKNEKENKKRTSETTPSQAQTHNRLGGN
jgi:hypothetical protein